MNPQDVPACLRGVYTPGANGVPVDLAWHRGRFVPPGPGAHAEISLHGCLVTPGCIDVHCHGLEHWVFDRGREDALEISRRLPRYGVTSVFPTLIPQKGDASLERIRDVARALPDTEGARFPGLHLEGPFVALGGAACWTTAGDLSLLSELLSAAQNQVKIMSVSPDTENILPVIEALVAAGVVPFITHTAASVRQTLRAIDAGARHATHFYDVFPIPEQEEPGVRQAGAVEALLADPRCSADFIADGVHVDPVVIRMALRALGKERVIAITDSNLGAGLADGVYPSAWGYDVRVDSRRGGVRVADENHPKQGALAGSALTMDRAMRNLRAWLPELSGRELWNLATRNPAVLTGLRDSGRLEDGAVADFVAWDSTWRPVAAWVNGTCVYHREVTTES